MSWEEALRWAYRRTEVLKEKCYVWGYQSNRNGWRYTFSADKPGFMGKDSDEIQGD